MYNFNKLLWICTIILFVEAPIYAIPKIILDTDISRIDSTGHDISDIDDLGALAILNALASKNLCQIICVVTNSRSDKVVEMVDAINTFYNNPGVPVGLKYGKDGIVEDKNSYSKYISESFNYSLKSINAPSSTELLRKVLLNVSENDTVIYIHADCIANWDFLCISSFLASKPDDISTLDGWELFNKKVDTFISYIPCLPNDNVSNNCPEWVDVPTTDESSLQRFLDNYNNTLIGNTTAVEEAHFPTKLWEQSERNPVKKAYEYYYSKTPPPWHNSNKIPESISIYGDGLGILFLMTKTSNKHLFNWEKKGCFLIDENQRLRWNKEEDNKDHSYFFTKPELHKELWDIVDQLICFELN